MSDETQIGQAESAPIEKDTQESLSNSNQPADVKAVTPTPEGELPEEVKERTKAEFEKLKEANRLLKQELEASRPKPQSVLESLRPQGGQVDKKEIATLIEDNTDLKGSEVEDVIKQLVDEDNYLDTDKLKKVLADNSRKMSMAEQRAAKAEEVAKMASEKVTKFEETEQMKRVYQEFPTLNPESENFDERFFQLVRNEMIGQLMENGQQDLTAATKKVMDIYRPGEAEAKKLEAATTQREQASAGVSAAQGKADLNQEDLVNRTKKGDREAIYARLQASGY
jgi:hypothetical protein